VVWEKLREFPHRRWNPLLEEWILVSPHRTKRPWRGKQEDVMIQQLPEYDPDCYLCPGNQRAGGVRNPEYDSTFVFVNDFSALLSGNTIGNNVASGKNFIAINGLVKEYLEVGECRVVRFSPKHNLSIPEMTDGEAKKVIDVWVEQYRDLISRDDISYVQIFENKGEIMGCSNPHPHCQIWAQKTIPTIPAREINSQEKYFKKNGKELLLTYLEWEIEQKERLVCQNEDWVVLVPHWAVWPFETLVLPRQAISNILLLSEKEKWSWADIILRLTRKYDQLFKISFPYSMGIHQTGGDNNSYNGIVLHQHFFPPLLRSATVKKFMVGYEMTCEPQRDFTPESATEILRKLPTGSD